MPAEGLGKAGIQLRAAWQDVDAHAVGRFQRRQPASAAVVHHVCGGGRRQVHEACHAAGVMRRAVRIPAGSQLVADHSGCGGDVGSAAR